MSDVEFVTFALPCPGVLELPDRNIQFFNLWDRPAPDGSGSRLSVRVAVDDERVIEMGAGDEEQIGSVTVCVDYLDREADREEQIRGSIRPA